MGDGAAPLAYAPDTLTNNELGWKTTWLDQAPPMGRRDLPGGLESTPKSTHLLLACSSGVTINGGNYRVRGVETFAADARVTAGLDHRGGCRLESQRVGQGGDIFLGRRNTDRFQLAADGDRTEARKSGGTLGSSLAGAPPFQGNIRARYEFAFDAYRAFAQIGVVHQSHSLSTTDRLTLDLQGKSVAYDLPAFTTYDAALGVGKDGWLVQVYGENLTDTRAELFANYALGYKAVTVNRPRTIGLRFSYKFSGRVAAVQPSEIQVVGDRRYEQFHRKPFSFSQAVGLTDVACFGCPEAVIGGRPVGVGH